MHFVVNSLQPLVVADIDCIVWIGRYRCFLHPADQVMTQAPLEVTASSRKNSRISTINVSIYDPEVQNWQRYNGTEYAMHKLNDTVSTDPIIFLCSRLIYHYLCIKLSEQWTMQIIYVRYEARSYSTHQRNIHQIEVVMVLVHIL